MDIKDTAALHAAFTANKADFITYIMNGAREIANLDFSDTSVKAFKDAHDLQTAATTAGTIGHADETARMTALGAMDEATLVAEAEKVLAVQKSVGTVLEGEIFAFQTAIQGHDAKFAASPTFAEEHDIVTNLGADVNTIPDASDLAARRTTFVNLFNGMNGTVATSGKDGIFASLNGKIDSLQAEIDACDLTTDADPTHLFDDAKQAKVDAGAALTTKSTDPSLKNVPDRMVAVVALTKCKEDMAATLKDRLVAQQKMIPNLTDPADGAGLFEAAQIKAAGLNLDPAAADTLPLADQYKETIKIRDAKAEIDAALNAKLIELQGKIKNAPDKSPTKVKGYKQSIVDAKQDPDATLTADEVKNLPMADELDPTTGAVTKRGKVSTIKHLNTMVKDLGIDDPAEDKKLSKGQVAGIVAGSVAVAGVAAVATSPLYTFKNRGTWGWIKDRLAISKKAKDAQNTPDANNKVPGADNKEEVVDPTSTKTEADFMKDAGLTTEKGLDGRTFTLEAGEKVYNQEILGVMYSMKGPEGKVLIMWHETGKIDLIDEAQYNHAREGDLNKDHVMHTHDCGQGQHEQEHEEAVVTDPVTDAPKEDVPTSHVETVIIPGCKETPTKCIPVVVQGPPGPKGDPGKNGLDGKDGFTPEAGENGNWWIDGKDTGKSWKGVDGKDGATPVIGDNGNWFIDGKDTGKPSRGERGLDGTNGTNGRDGVDGKDGQTGAAGRDGVDGKDGQTGAAGRDGVDGTNGTNGRDGTDGTNGRDGVDGQNGRDGVDGTNGRDGVDGQNGRDGVDGKDGAAGWAHCERVDGGVRITCSDGSTAMLYDGKDGVDGRNGVDGRDGQCQCAHDVDSHTTDPFGTRPSTNVLGGLLDAVLQPLGLGDNTDIGGNVADIFDSGAGGGIIEQVIEGGANLLQAGVDAFTGGGLGQRPAVDLTGGITDVLNGGAGGGVIEQVIEGGANLLQAGVDAFTGGGLNQRPAVDLTGGILDGGNGGGVIEQVIDAVAAPIQEVANALTGGGRSGGRPSLLGSLRGMTEQAGNETVAAGAARVGRRLREGASQLGQILQG